MKTIPQFEAWLHRQMIRMEPLDDSMSKPGLEECLDVARRAGKLAGIFRLGGEPYRSLSEIQGPADCFSMLADCLQLLGAEPEPEQPEQEPATMTVAQAARRLGCSERTLYDMVRDDRIGHYRVGSGRGSIRFRPEDLTDYQRATQNPAVPVLDSEVPVLRHLQL
jgi:excisionase family DNA binding protein